MFKKTITLLSLMLVMQAQAFITVGDDNDDTCNYHSIQAAIDSNESDEIRIASNKDYFENIVVLNESIELIGGYADCVMAVDNSPDGSQAYIQADGVNNAIELTTKSAASYVVLLRNLSIANGSRGLLIYPQIDSVLSVIIDNVRVYNNSEVGVNIQKSQNATAHVLVNNSQIDFNQSGGLRCSDSENTLKIAGQTVISDNTGANFGGGIAIFDGCFADVYSPTKIINNEANYGGGISANNGSAIFLYGFAYGEQNGINLGEWQSPVEISGNEATVAGGAIIAANNESHVSVYNALIENNQAFNSGAALNALGESSILASGYKEPGQNCWAPSACLQIKGNKTILAGTIAATTNSNIIVSGALITENKANTGVVSNAENGGDISISNSTINHNGKNNDDDYSNKVLFKTQSGNNLISKTTLEFITVVNNYVTESIIQNQEGSVTAYSSILLDEVDVYSESGQVSQFHIECAMVREDTSFNAGNAVSVTNDNLEDIFVDPATGNYHLAAESPAIDYCYEIADLSNKDIDGDERGIDNPNMPGTGLGFYDIGADEFSVINNQPSMTVSEQFYVALSEINNPAPQTVACDFVMGPENEASQKVKDMLVTVINDTSGILTSIDVDNSGQLSYSFSGNAGIAEVSVALQDDGGTEGGGVDTSIAHTFYVNVADYIYLDDFEKQACE